MEMNKKRILLLAFFITLFVFLCIMLIGTIVDNQRLKTLDNQFQQSQRDISDVQQLVLMSEVYGKDIACVTFPAKLRDIDKTIWDLGIKLEQYRAASEEFQKDPYYTLQKKIFNQQETLYLMLLTQIKQKCNYSQSIISFFYSNAQDCPKCDDQSFVLADINRDIDKEVSIFSFDTELNLSSVDLLKDYYKLDQLPCLIIDEHKYCGIRSKDFVIQKICEYNNLTVCPQNNKNSTT